MMKQILSLVVVCVLMAMVPSVLAWDTCTVDSSKSVILSNLSHIQSNLNIQQESGIDKYVFSMKWGSKSYSSDGQFDKPCCIAIDAAGNMYVAEDGNNRVQKIDSAGNFLAKWGSPGSDDGQFSDQYPFQIAIDNSKNIYVVDTGNSRIQKFDSAGNFLTQWGSYGSNNGQFIRPKGIATDETGNIYVADTYNSRIQIFDSAGNFLTTLGSRGSGDGELKYPSGVFVDSLGNTYVADTGNYRVQKFDSAGNFITKWGSQGYNDGQFSQPVGIVVDGAGNVYVVDVGNCCVQRFDSSGNFITKLESYGSNDGKFNNPLGIAVDTLGNMYVADTGNNRIQKFDGDGNFCETLGSQKLGDGELYYPEDIVVDASGNVYVADSDNFRIQKFDSCGNFITKWGSYGVNDGEFIGITGIAVDPVGNVYVTEWDYDLQFTCIQKFDNEGNFITKWNSFGSSSLSAPCGIAVDDSGNVYVVDRNANCILKFDSSGKAVTKWGSYGSGEGQFWWPEHIAVDASDNVYVIDFQQGSDNSVNNRIQKFDSNGNFLASWLLEGGGLPCITCDTSGNVYVGNYIYVNRFDGSGNLTLTLKSQGSNDGHISYPSGMAIDASGNLYVLDNDNHHIQKFEPVIVPVVNFIANVTSGTAPLIVKFSDTSSGSPSSWFWDFGDGNFSTEQNPIHAYNTGHIFTVTLEVTYNQTGYSKTKLDYITIISPDSPLVNWQRCFGGSDRDRGYSVQQTPDGGYIIAGETASKDGDVIYDNKNGDVWIVKINKTGSIEWQRVLGGSGYESARSIRKTPDGGYIFVAYTNSMDGDVVGGKGWDTWVVKLDATGAIEWQRCYGGSSCDEARSIRATSDGGYIFVGLTDSNDCDVSGYHGSDDAWLVKINSTGMIEWQRCYGGTSIDSAEDIMQTQDGGYIIAGYTYSGDGDVEGNHGLRDVWVVKTDGEGNIEWQRCFGGTQEEAVFCLDQTSDGGFVLAGFTCSSVDGDVYWNHGGKDIWILKFNSSWVLEGQALLGGSSNDFAGSIQQSADGGYIIVGGTVSDDGDVSGFHTDPNDPIQLSTDAWLVKLDENGDYAWQRCLGGRDEDVGSSVEQTTDHGYVIVGHTCSNNNGDVVGYHGYSDLWVVKLTADSDSSVFADRTINPASLSPQHDVNITINFFGATEEKIVLKEQIPSGWSITPISSTADSEKISGSSAEWIWNGATSEDSVMYRISVPVSAPAGTYRFFGTLSSKDHAVLVSGDNAVRVTELEGEIPVIQSVSKTYQGYYFTDIPLVNTFELGTEGEIDHIDFDVNGAVTTDSDGSDGWGYTFDMGSLEPWTVITITAYSPDGVPSQPYIITPSIVCTPEWFSTLVASTETKPYAVSSGKNELIYEIKADISFPKTPLKGSVTIPKSIPMSGKYGLDVSGTVGGKLSSDGKTDFHGGGSTEISIADQTGKIKSLVGGVWVLSPDEDGTLTIKFREVYIDLNGEAEVPIPGATYNFAIGKVYASVDTGIDGKLYFTEDPDGAIIGGLGLSGGQAKLDAKIKGTFKTGSENVYFKIVLSGGAVIVMTVPPPEVSDYYIILKAEGKAVAGPYSSSVSASWRYPGDDSTSMALSIPPISSSEWEPIPRDYVGPGYGRFGEPEVTILATTQSSSAENASLIDSCYPYAAPTLLTLPDGRLLLLWTHDVPEKPQMQGLEIMYSVYNDGGWSAPQGVTDNLIDDYDATAVIDGTGAAIALWSSIANPSITADTPMAEAMNATELAWSRFVPEQGAWSEPALLTHDSCYDGRASLSAGADGAVAAVWTKDRDGDIFTTGDQDVLYATWNGTAWSDPATVAKNISVTAGPVVSPPGTIAWAADIDGDADTRTDREIFVVRESGLAWGTLVQVTANTVEDLEPVFQADGGEWLAWVEREEECDRVCVVQTAAAGTSAPETAAIRPSVNELHLMKTETANLLAVWQGASDEGQDLFLSVRDAASGHWSGGSQVTHSEIDEWQISPALVNGELGTAYLSSDNETSALDVLVRPIRMDCAVDAAEITYADGTLSTVVRNIGDLPAESVDVVFTDGEGGPAIGDAQTIASLPAGENRTVSVVWLPADNDTHEITVTVDPDAVLVEVDTTNNRATATFFLPDVVVEDLKVGRTSLSVIEWRVGNTGEGAAYDVPVRVYDLNGSVIDERVIADLQPGTAICGTATWDWSDAAAGTHTIVAEADPDETMQDADRENNQASQQVVFTPDLILNAISLASSDPGSGPVLLNVTVWNDGDCAAENVTLTATDGAAAANGTICGTGVISAISPGESSVLQLEANLSAGLHTVSVRAENGGPEIDCSNNLAQTTISVVRVPVANFTATITGTGRVQFTDRSTNTPTVWLWDFGDGTTSDAQHPLHTYATDGTYMVGLTVCNEFGSDETVRADAVVVTGVGGPVTAAGDADVYSGTVPLTVQFTDRSSGGPTAWCWSFGDGTTSDAQHPVHAYTEEGNYSVSLLVRNGTYEDTCTLESHIMVQPGLAAAFDANVTSGVAPLTVRFTDTSSGNPTAWLWTFGDGNTSTDQNPTHTYTAPGNYTVSLAVNGGEGAYTRPAYIMVTPVLFGDANEDGVVNQVDTLRVLKQVVGLSTKPAADTEQFTKTDVHRNGAIEVGDALFIAQYNVGLRDAWFALMG